MRYLVPEQKVLNQRIRELDSELKSIRVNTLKEVSAILREEGSLQSFHGIIGGKNNTYTNCIQSQFLNPEIFLASWMQGLMTVIRNKDSYEEQKYGRIYQNSSAHNTLRFLLDETIYKYISMFHERNFFKQYYARIREKPNQYHWQLWFGEKKMFFGLLIAPVLRNGEWTNDKSEIRRAKYDYWTIGHVLETGLVSPTSEQPIPFSDVDELLSFYSSILKQISHPTYEHPIADRYIDYIQSSSQPLAEPFMIPEFRFDGDKVKHGRRLDFIVLNSHTTKFTGYELSPASTHMKITKIKVEKKTQKKINEELREKWHYEMEKRRRFYNSLGITVITFTDPDLQDIDSCFDTIKKDLSDRQRVIKPLSTIREDISKYKFL